MKSKAQKRKYEAVGRRAENRAALYLRMRGYRILARRYKTKLGEIDLVASHKGVLVMVEVKQRLTRAAAHDSISASSAQRIRNAADLYVAKNRAAQNCGVRFDAVFFIGPKPSLFSVEHIVDAF